MSELRDLPVEQRLEQLATSMRSLALPPGGKASIGRDGDSLPGLNAAQLEHVLARVAELERLMASAQRRQWDHLDDAIGQVILRDVALVTGQFRTSLAHISSLLDEVITIISAVKSAVPVAESALATLAAADDAT